MFSIPGLLGYTVHLGTVWDSVSERIKSMDLTAPLSLHGSWWVRGLSLGGTPSPASYVLVMISLLCLDI